MFDANKGFTLIRTFEATPDEVWQAWTDPDTAALWWHPRGASTPRDSVEIDARVGGRYTYAVVNDATGDTVVTGGEYREVVPPERLVFTWGDPNGEPNDRRVVTVTLEEVDSGTRMTFDMRGIDGAEGDGDVHDGWEQALDALGAMLGQARTGR